MERIKKIKGIKVRCNEEIRAPQVRVIDESGTQLGIYTPREATSIAKQRGFDLIEVVPNATPPVCKIMDFGKFKYEIQKKEKLQKKNQQIISIKEIRLHPNTDVHDFDFKAKHAEQFINDGHKVKVSVIFRGRQITYVEQGENIMKRFIERLSLVAKIDQEVKLEGKSLNTILTQDKSLKKTNKIIEK
ncbi:MAG: translation initiation factor IF-3 [Ignavibacteria bacterium]|nr:translation initiation factor IF-3 [Bacteroidota bacterium]MSQ45467.1 translation initiation factor IF-3 [Ignavibacteria bacterium]